jgi:hypothetical protein
LDTRINLLKIEGFPFVLCVKWSYPVKVSHSAKYTLQIENQLRELHIVQFCIFLDERKHIQEHHIHMSVSNPLWLLNAPPVNPRQNKLKFMKRRTSKNYMDVTNKPLQLEEFEV